MFARGHVVYVDADGREHQALVTAVWRDLRQVEDDPDPSLNLVIVSPDVARTDPYGRQVERRTRVQHQSRTRGDRWRRAAEPALAPAEEVLVAL